MSAAKGLSPDLDRDVKDIQRENEQDERYHYG
jgi:hypothetical protein